MRSCSKMLLEGIKFYFLLASWTFLTGVAAGSPVWIEGEKPDAIPFGLVDPISPSAHPEFLSGGKWLALAIEPGDQEKAIPVEGLQLSYSFQNSDAGQHEVWARIGFEFARAPFDWRIDDGQWKTVKPEELTSDLMSLEFWKEIGWLDLGQVDLPVGPHKFEIRLLRYKNEKGEFQRILFALDAVCMSQEVFQPYSKFKSGENPRDARDEEAAKNIFQLPEASTPEIRTSVKLGGLWEVARHDEQTPGDVAAPITDFPHNPVWKAITIPSDKNENPALLFCHRLWFRTRVNVPASLMGHSFHLVLPCDSLNTTVAVNGVMCGFDKNPFARVQIDVTKGIKPGQVNEIWVGIKDAWYARDADPKDPMKLRRTFNIPLSLFGSGFQTLVYPVWNQPKSGILDTPELVAAGSVYASDVFAKPSVARQELGMEITLTNSTSQAVSGEVSAEAVNDKTGQVEMTAPSQSFSLNNGANIVLNYAAPWKNPKLWWPDSPTMYRLRTTVKVAGQTVDIKETPFGFREWSIDGSNFRLNGIKWQGFSEQGVSHQASNVEELASIMHDPKYNYAFIRSNLDNSEWLGQETPDVLDNLDQAGIIVRRCGALDGEAIGYNPDLLTPLGSNWLDQLGAWIKGERNHPSIMIWSVENEVNFITARNLGRLDTWEPILQQAWQLVQKVDPTRPIMIDGGGATRSQALPVHGDHYSTKAFTEYPQLAYEANADQSPWTRDWKRPVFIGEELFAAGTNPNYAYFGGEQVFLGKEGNRTAVGKAMQVINQGYRWFGIGAVDFCQGPSDADGSQYNSWAPRAVLVRQWDWTFGSGEKARRTFGIFNNTRFPDPLTFNWTLTLAGKEVGKFSQQYNVPPGENQKFDLDLTIPHVTKRQEGELTLTLSTGGKEVFRDVKAISVLPIPPKPLGTRKLFVYDPKQSVTPYLSSSGIRFQSLGSLASPPEAGAVWLVGRDALSENDSTTNAFSLFASTGGRVILLEQTHPLRFQGLNPAEADTSTNTGRTAFLNEPSHPILSGLQDKDFFTWEPEEIVYRNAYLKPSRGAHSLLEVNEGLTHSALLYTPIGTGVMILDQTVLSEKLNTNATARALLSNLLNYAQSYQLERKTTAASVDDSLATVLDSINLQYTRIDSPLSAIQKASIAVVSATPDRLKMLCDNLPAVKSFTANGGWIVLHGLTPDGLNSFNQLVGFDHMIRPFRREKVTFSSPRNPLLSGLGLSDIALLSSKSILSFQSGNYAADDTFSYVVDLDDVAPFAKPVRDFHYNLVNGFTSADGWPLICNEKPEDSVYVFTLPKPQTLKSWIWTGNVLYNATTQVSMTVDGNEAGKLLFDVPGTGNPTALQINPPQTGTVFTIRHEKYGQIPEKMQNGQNIIGCDNINLFASRPPDFHDRVRPMLNIGTLVEYPQGKGGIILANLLFKDREDVPVNGTKKREVIATILRNLKASFSGKTIIAGGNLTYTPIDLSKQANQFRTERGWFGDANRTFRDIPIGEQHLAGVKYNIYDFPTSPVPTVIMLGGSNVPNNLGEQVVGIPVGTKADALFFLQAARIDQPLNNDEVGAKKIVEMAKYVVHYADGKTEEIPLNIGQNIANYNQKTPAPLPGAQIAWARPWDSSDESAVAYSMQWNNPRPDMAIETIDLVYGKDRRGVPALIALSAARAQ